MLKNKSNNYNIKINLKGTGSAVVNWINADLD